LERACEVRLEPEGATQRLVTSIASTPSALAEAPRVGRDRWLRRSLAVAWLIFFAMGGLAVASTWDRLVQGLVQAPVPVSTTPVLDSEMAAGDHGAAEAERRAPERRGPSSR
jgi:hypothetical protein